MKESGCRLRFFRVETNEREEENGDFGGRQCCIRFDRDPAGRRDRCLGGAATYFSLAASYFTGVRVIAVVGEDFTAEHEAVLNRRGVDTRGLEHTSGKSFHWTGSYLEESE